MADLIVSTEPRAELGGERQFAYYPGHGDGQFGCDIDLEVVSGFPVPPLNGSCEDTPYVQLTSENSTLLGARRIRLTSLPSFAPYTLSAHRPMFVDMDGDGLADFVDAMNDHLEVLVNLDGHTFQNSCAMGYEGCAGLPGFTGYSFNFPASASTRIAVADVDGNEVPDLVAISKNEVRVLSFDNVVDANTTTKLRAGRLIRVTNNMGVRSSFEYFDSLASAALFASGQTPEWLGTSGDVWHTFSEQSAQPLRALTVVSAADTALPRIDKEKYYYWDPAYDVWERRLVGFRRRSVSTLAGPLRNTNVTYSFFGDCELTVAAEVGTGGPVATTNPCAGTSRSGPDRLIRGMPYWTESGDGARILTATQFTYTAHAEEGAPNATPTFAVPSRTDTFTYDLSTFNPSATDIVTANVLAFGGESPRTREIDRRDPAGRRHTARSKVVNGLGLTVDLFEHGDVEEQDGETRVQTVYDCDLPPNGWACETKKVTLSGSHSNGVLATPRVEEVIARDATCGHAKTIAVTHNTAAVGLARAVASNAPSPFAQGMLFVAAQYQYDPQCNVVEARGPSFSSTAGLVSSCGETHYDLNYGYFPVRTNVCGSNALRVDRTYDWVSAQVLTSVAEFSAHSAVTYDGYGRRTAEYAPDPVTGLPVLAVDYLYQVTSGDSLRKSRRRVHNPDGADEETWLYEDGAGRPLFHVRRADTWEMGGTPWVAEGLTYQYDADLYVHRPFSVSDPSSVALQWNYEALPGARLHYDDFGRLTETYYAGELTGRREYRGFTTHDWDRATAGSTGAAQMETEVDGFSRVKHRLVRTGAKSVHSNFDYLHTHQATRVRMWTPDQSAPEYERWMLYDGLGRMVLNVEPNTSPNYQGPYAGNAPGLKAWRYVYDDAGHLVGTSDPRGCGKNLIYDELGRLQGEDYAPCSASQEPYSAPAAGGAGLEVQYFYSATLGEQGRLVRVRDRASDVEVDHDQLGRAVQVNKRITKPDAASSDWATRFAAHEFTTSTEFDYAGRLVKQHTGADVPELLNLVGESWVKYLYSPAGAATTTESSYDLGDTGKMLRQHHADAEGRALETLYGDAAGTTVFPSYYENTERLSYVSIMRTQTPTFWAAGQGNYTAPPPGPQTYLVADMIYRDTRGNPTDVVSVLYDGDWPAGAKPSRRKMTYDDQERLKDVEYCYGSNCTPGVETDTFVSPFAHEASVGDSRPVPPQTATHRPLTQHIDYDWRGKILGSTDDASMRFDRSIGAVLASNAGPPDAIHDTDGGLHAQYDDAGNMVELLVERGGFCAGGKCAHRFVYDWDEIGQLVRARRWDYTSLPVGAPVYPSLPGATADWDVRYAYSGGQRVLKSSLAGGVDRHTLNVFGSLRVEQTSYDAVANDYAVDATTEVVYLDGFARVVFDATLPSPSGNAVHVFFTIGDPQGSSSLVVDKETGELVEKTSYMAYGAVESDYRPSRWASQRDAFKYTGKEADVEVGLTYFGARYYSPHLHQWISPDPLTIHGAVGDANPYAFVQGSPQRYVDPFGLSPTEHPTSCVVCGADGGTGTWADLGRMGESIGRGFGAVGSGIADGFAGLANDLFGSDAPQPYVPRGGGIANLPTTLAELFPQAYKVYSERGGTAFDPATLGDFAAELRDRYYTGSSAFLQGIWNAHVSVALSGLYANSPGLTFAKNLGLVDLEHHTQFAPIPCAAGYMCNAGQSLGGAAYQAALTVATAGAAGIGNGGRTAITLVEEAGSVAAEGGGALASGLSDATLVCRGGTCTAARFASGSGVTVDSAGALNGVSVNSAQGATLEELAAGIPNRQIGVTTVGQVRALGGNVIRSPTRGNPFHSTLSGVTAEQAERLFTPTIQNPTLLRF